MKTIPLFLIWVITSSFALISNQKIYMYKECVSKIANEVLEKDVQLDYFSLAKYIEAECGVDYIKTSFQCRLLVSVSGEVCFNSLIVGDSTKCTPEEVERLKKIILGFPSIIKAIKFNDGVESEYINFIVQPMKSLNKIDVWGDNLIRKD